MISDMASGEFPEKELEKQPRGAVIGIKKGKAFKPSLSRCIDELIVLKRLS